MKVIFLAVLIFSASVLAGPSTAPATTKPANAQLAGTWRVTRTWMPGSDDQRKYEYILTLKITGSKLTGTASYVESDQTHFLPLLNGKVDGDQFSFQTHRNGWMTDWNGKLENGALTGSIAQFIVTGTWQGQRVDGQP